MVHSKILATRSREALSDVKVWDALKDSETTVQQLVSLGQLAPAGSSARKLAGFVAGALTAITVGREIRSQWAPNIEWIVTIGSNDPFYETVVEWLQKRTNTNIGRVFRLGVEDAKPVFRPSLVANACARVSVDGVAIEVEVRRLDPANSVTQRQNRPTELVFTSRSERGFNALRGELLTLRSMRSNDCILYTHDEYEWVETRTLKTRSVESVVLPEGQHERVSEDLETFLASEQAYIDMGLPYHRGYLFSGPPGTGKTSYATSLAALHHRNIFYLSLSNVLDDARLFQIVNDIPDNAILLVEDIDASGSPTRESANAEGNKLQGVTFAGLLNALDGVATPHGLITIITTNYPERLDPALTRSGRIDMSEQFSYLTGEQCLRLMHRFLPKADFSQVRIPDGDLGVPPSDVMDIVKRFQRNPSGAALELLRVLSCENQVNVVSGQ
jgi:hypothetical protein